MHPTLAGSKRRLRAAQREQRRVEAVKNRLRKIYGLARLLETEAELDALLAAIPDDAVRAETKKLIEPFCLFSIAKVTLADAVALDETTTAMRETYRDIYHQAGEGGAPPPLVIDTTTGEILP